MDILVEGKGTKYFTPDQITFDLQFVVKANAYEEVLEKGVLSVQDFINEVLIENGFTKEDLKTRSFVVSEEVIYNPETQKQEFQGYSYNQYATISFHHSIDLMADIITDVSKLEIPPTYQITFNLNNEEKVREEVLKLAYQDAENKANAIAQAALKNLKRCTKVDSKPFDNIYNSNSNLDNNFLNNPKMLSNITNIITTSFTPEDIEITERLYCLWIAE